MFAGQIIMEDQTISFVRTANNMVDFTITEMNPKGFMVSETKTVNAARFMKALSIAVHNDGTPDYNADYPDAESIMGDIRWIP